MDPLGTAASLLAVIKLAGNIAKYVASAAGATAARRKLREEVMACERVLQDILFESSDFDAGEKWKDTVEALEAPGAPLGRLMLALKAVETKLQPKTGSAGNIRNSLGLSCLAWPFTEKEVQQLLETIEREKSLLMLALENDCRRLIKKIDQTTKDNQQLLMDLVGLTQKGSEEDSQRALELAETLHRVELSQATLQKGLGHLHNQEEQNRKASRRREILEWLTPVDYVSQQSDYINQREPGTGQWLLESPEFKEWLSGTGKRTLFCPGIPGAGKTTLTAVVIEEVTTIFRNDKTVAIAFIYCDFRRQHQQNARDLLSSLLRQIAQRDDGLPAISEALELLHERYMENKTRPSADVLSKLLHSIVSAYSRVFVFVDALDECQIRDGCRSQLASEVLALRKIFDAVNIFITSRWIPDIVELFLPEHTLSVEIRANLADVRKYTENRLSQLPAFVARNKQLQMEIVEGIEDAVDGMFLLAQLHLDSLVGKKSPKALRAALVQLPSGTQAYDHAYKDAMRRIESQVIDQVELAKQALSWIICARRPLTTAELQHALAIELDTDEFDPESIPQLEDIVSSCAGLVAVDKESDIVRLVHYTTQEYFERTKDEWFPNMEGELAIACVTYLSYSRFNGLHSMPQDVLTRTIHLYPFYNYACYNWGHHAQVADLSDSRPYLDRIVQFLQPDNESSWSTVSIVFGDSDRFHYPGGHKYGSSPTQFITGIHLAAYFGIPEVLSVFFARGVSLDWPDNKGRTPLSWAAENGHTLVVDMLLRQGVAADSKNSDGLTPLSWAAKRGHEEIVRLLLRQGADPDSVCNSGRTPLSRAASNGHISIVRLLIEERKVRIDYADENGATPLFRAAYNGHTPVVEYLCRKKGADVNASDIHGRTPLMMASAWTGDFECALVLLDHGADHETRRYDGMNALSWACRCGNTDIVQLLLQRGADPEIESSSTHMTPLFWAARYGHTEIIDLLLSNYSGQISEENKRRYEGYRIGWAVEYGDIEMTESMLQQGVDMNVRDHNEETPLHVSIRRGHVSISGLLLDKGADIEARDVNGFTPLLVAANNTREESTQLMGILLERNANIDAQDKYGSTSLLLAVRRRHFPTVELLVARGADVQRPDCSGRTPLMEAVIGGSREIIQLILKIDRNLLAQNNEGRTVLMWAILYLPGDEDLVRQLISKEPALINMADRQQNTPLGLAANKGGLEVIKVLLDAGASMESGPDNWSALYLAATRSHESAVTELLNKGADPNGQCRDQRTPLVGACLVGSVNVAKMLLDAGADVNSGDIWGDTPLYHSAANNHLAIVDLLLDNGALPMIKGRNGETPLLEAAARGHVAVVERLSRAGTGGALINSQDTCGRTPLHWAIIKKQVKVVELLLQNGEVDVELGDFYGSTPLSVAARVRPFIYSLELVKLLLRTGKVTVTSKDCFQRTPLWWARRAGNGETEEILRRYTDEKEVLMAELCGSQEVPAAEALQADNTTRGYWAYCDICLTRLKGSRYRSRVRCSECNGGNFDICQECIEAGGKCLDTTGTHLLSSPVDPDGYLDSDLESDSDGDWDWV